MYGREERLISKSFSIRDDSCNDGLAVTELASEGVTVLESDGVLLNPLPETPVVVVQLLMDGEDAMVDPLSLRERAVDGAVLVVVSLLSMVLVVERDEVECSQEVGLGVDVPE